MSLVAGNSTSCTLRDCEQYFFDVINIVQHDNFQLKVFLKWVVSEVFLFEYGLRIFGDNSKTISRNRFFARYGYLKKIRDGMYYMILKCGKLYLHYWKHVINWIFSLKE